MGDSRSSKRVVLRRGKRAEGLSGQLHFASHYATRLPPSAASHRSAVTGDRTAQHPWGSRLDRPAAVSFEAQRTRSGISATSAIGRRIDGDVTTAVAVAGGSDRSLGAFTNESWSSWQARIATQRPRYRSVLVPNANDVTAN